MGKKGEKLLRLLRSNSGRTTSEKVNSKLASDKPSANQNDYFCSAGQCDDEMGSISDITKIANSKVIEEESRSYQPEILTKNNVQESVFRIQPTMDFAPLSQNNANREATRGKMSVNSSDCTRNYGNSDANTANSNNYLPKSQSHRCEKTVPSKRHPPSSETFINRTPHGEGRVFYKKEFPSKKRRSVDEEEFPHILSKAKFLTSHSSAPTSPATNFHYDNKRPFSDTDQPSSSGLQRNSINHHKDDGVEWGWLQNNPSDLIAKENSQIGGFENHKSYVNEDRQTSFSSYFEKEQTPHTYVNEHFSEINMPRVVFTVSDKKKNRIKLTIAVYGITNRREKDEIFDSYSEEKQRHLSSLSRDAHRIRSGYFKKYCEDIVCDRHTHRLAFEMSPNPDAMSSIEQVNEFYRQHRNRSTMFQSHFSHVKSQRVARENYNLTEESIKKLKSYCGHNSPESLIISSEEKVEKLNNLAKILERVEECPWYWGNLSGSDSKKVLAGAEIGTFLLRLSSDPKYLFSLSVKTKYGPTSIRIVYDSGFFRFDSDMNNNGTTQQHERNESAPTNRKGYPNYVHKSTNKFTCVIHLVLHHTKHLIFTKPDEENDSTSQVTLPDRESNASMFEDRPGELFMCYWVSRTGRREIPVFLSTPLPKKQYFPSLQVLCRNVLSKNNQLWKKENEDLVDEENLPQSIKRFLKKYPFPL